MLDRQVHGPGQVGHHHDRALEHPDQQQFAAGVIGVDLRGELGDPLLQAARAVIRTSSQVGAHVSRVHPRPSTVGSPTSSSLPYRRWHADAARQVRPALAVPAR